MNTALQDTLISVPGFSALVDQIGATELPTVICSDPEFDDTVIDFSDSESVTMTQTDEHGVTHTIVLSAQIIAQYSPYMLLWKSKNLPSNVPRPMLVD